MDLAKILLEESQKCFSVARRCEDEAIARELCEIANTLLAAAQELSEIRAKPQEPE